MKILHINSYYSGSKFYKNLYDKQINSGLDIDVFVPVSSAFIGSEGEFGTYTTLSSNHKKYDRLIFHLKHHKIYKDIVSKYDISSYSAIHAHSLFSNGYVAMKLKKKYGIPYVVAVRNTDVNTFFKRMIHLRRMGIEILKNADSIIFLSKSYRDEVVEKYIPNNIKELIIDKILIVPNGIDDFWIGNRINKRFSLDKRDLKLLYVGVVNKNKNIMTTVKAIEHLRKQDIEARLTVVGRVEDHSIYRQIKKKEYVSYLEPKSRNELLEIYRQNDIFIMPSIHESFGLVYAEAMSQGLPVIYTRGQGFDGQIDDGTVGFAVDSNDYYEIANKINMIVAAYDKLSKNCLYSTEVFNWRDISRDYNNLYHKIVQNH